MAKTTQNKKKKITLAEAKKAVARKGIKMEKDIKKVKWIEPN